MLNTCIISTSPRPNSNSLRASRYLQNLFQQQPDIAEGYLIDFEQCDVPMVGRGSINKQNLTPFQQKLINSWEKAHIVVWVLPEYNWSTNAEVINLLHQIGGKDFSYLLHNKIFTLVGVSSGRGGRVPCLDLTTVLNKVISFTNSFSVISPRLLESHETDKNLDAQGNSLGNAAYENASISFVDYTLNMARRWSFEEALVGK